MNLVRINVLCSHYYERQADIATFFYESCHLHVVIDFFLHLVNITVIMSFFPVFKYCKQIPVIPNLFFK